MSEVDRTVFLSYRRDVSQHIARSVFLDLRHHDYDVFMDVESINSGTFDTIILDQIVARAHFVLVLTHGSLDRCVNENDWLRIEIEHAIDLQRNIVPLLFDGFTFDARTQQLLTGRLAELPRYNGVTVPHEYFDAAMERLRSRFLKQELVGSIITPPEHDQVFIRHQMAELLDELSGPAAPPRPFPAGPSTLEQRVNLVIQDILGADVSALTPETRFREDLEADSLDLVELVMAFEEEFGGEISDEEAEQIETVGEAVEYIRAHMA